MGLALDDVRLAVAAANADSPKGSIDGKTQSYSLAANDQLFGADEYRKIVVGTRNGAPIRLDAVATVIDGVENARVAGWHGGETNVRESLVMSSELTPKGPIYTVLSRAKLG